MTILNLSTKGTYTRLTELLSGQCYVAVPENDWRGDPFWEAALVQSINMLGQDASLLIAPMSSASSIAQQDYTSVEFDGVTYWVR